MSIMVKIAPVATYMILKYSQSLISGDFGDHVANLELLYSVVLSCCMDYDHVAHILSVLSGVEVPLCHRRDRISWQSWLDKSQVQLDRLTSRYRR